MALPGDYGSDLQRLLLLAYKSTGLGDESLGEALQAADHSGRSVGSSKVVEAWRAGRSHMTLGALEVALEHCGPELAGRLLNVLCRRYGHEAVRLPGASSSTTPLKRRVLLIGAVTGDVQGAYAEATDPDGDGGAEITDDESDNLLELTGLAIQQLVTFQIDVIHHKTTWRPK